MKFVTPSILGLAATGMAAPSLILHKRDDFCGQWDTANPGDYTLYNNLWNMNAGTGEQCTGVDSIDGSNLAWHTSWTWSGGQNQVKSFANAVLTMDPKQISAISSLKTTWDWSYTGSNIVADVAYDIFTSSTAQGENEYEVMIWLAALGGAGPISSSGSSVATVEIDGVSWDLYDGYNGDMHVFSFVASSPAKSFSGDLMDFLSYLNKNQNMPASQYVLSIGAGTEPFSGSDAVLTTTAYSVVAA